MRRRVVWLSVGGTSIALAVAGAFVYHSARVKDVRGSPTIEFSTTDVATFEQPIGELHPPSLSVPQAQARFVWSTFGYSGQRLRSPTTIHLRPPFRRLWTFPGHSLLEFPPAIAHGRLYLPTFAGRVLAIDPETGTVVWTYDSGRCAWGSPAISGNLVIQTFIGQRGSCQEDVPGSGGEVVAFDGATGAIRWRRVHGRDESSPVVVHGLVYGGDWSGQVYALDATTGKPQWTFQTGGEVKGSAAVDRERLFIGSYDGHVYALDAGDGTLLWRASGQSRFGAGGRFYSTPAVAYGRVYIGSTDGKVYSFGAASGKLRWSMSTGSYVYASPAIWNQLVLIGSYDGYFYALDAATGDVRWRFDAGGRISGSATVIDGIVYFSTFERRTFGLDAATGRPVWTFPDGFYSPVVADPERLYLVGALRLYALAER